MHNQVIDNIYVNTCNGAVVIFKNMQENFAKRVIFIYWLTEMFCVMQNISFTHGSQQCQGGGAYRRNILYYRGLFLFSF